MIMAAAAPVREKPGCTDVEIDAALSDHLA
jgi:hypothetical protein